MASVLDSETVLAVSGLGISFTRGGTDVPVVRDVSFDVAEGQSLGIVGESGCGKSMTVLGLQALLPRGFNAHSGTVRLLGRDLLPLAEAEMSAVRGLRIGTVFQDPQSSLNPLMTVGAHVVEPLRKHLRLTKSAARRRAIELLREVEVPEPDKRVDWYPHQLSGGMRQRVMIASALACDPQLLIADEATTALDVTIQASIVNLLRRLKSERGLAMIFVSHDLPLVAELVDEVVVMYAGQIVERAPTRQLFSNPQHPYTEALLAAAPRIDAPHSRRSRHAVLPGTPPAMGVVSGCPFAPRCPHAALDPSCEQVAPDLVEIAEGHWVRTTHPRATRLIHAARAEVM